MPKQHILIVFGTRPEAIKMLPLIIEFKKYPDLFDLKICSTGQHKDLLFDVLNTFKIKPDINFNIMSKNQNLSDITEKLLKKFNELYKSYKPDYVLVHGDTTTSFASSLASFYNKIKICHVEAGLRTNNKLDPWPEEMNRQLNSKLADIHFAPTQLNKKNLISENIDKKNIIVTGNTIIDCLKISQKILLKNPSLNKILLDRLKIDQQHFENWKTKKRKLFFLTIHRRENFGENLDNILETIKEILENNANLDVIFPVHPNPNIKMKVESFFNNLKLSNLYLTTNLSYLEMIAIYNSSTLILTDSGGIQEEAPYFNIPVLVLRETTERIEALENGKIELVGTNKKNVLKKINLILNDTGYKQNFLKMKNPYGNGNSSKKIVNFLKNN